MVDYGFRSTATRGPCQRAIAEVIVGKGADYVMGLKGNHETALEEVTEFFADARANDFKNVPHTFHQTVDGSEHGRLEVRRVWSTQDIGWFEDLARWRGLRSIIMVERERTVGDGKTSSECHYYWSSRKSSAEVFARIIQGGAPVRSEKDVSTFDWRPCDFQRIVKSTPGLAEVFYLPPVKRGGKMLVGPHSSAN